uniref:SRS domain-containing protein n=1 Tax=Sarcocystis aucheniae TaxID=65407 RepID=A0A5P9S3Q4_9APIC|nr:hypothetical protein [Sarcocystis aucheniae]
MAQRARPVIALVLLVPSHLAAGNEKKISLTCTTEGGVVKAEVLQEGTSVTVECVSGATVTPKASDSDVTNVLIGPNCDVVQPLDTVCPKATGSKLTDTLTFNITQMPPASRQFCIVCGKNPGADCTAQVYVKVPAAPGSPPICETPGGSIRLNLPASGDRVTFSCAYGLHLTPTTATKVFADDCTNEEDLPKMELDQDENGGYTVTATNKPPKKRFCYLCGPKSQKKTTQNESKFCAVYIQAGAGTRTFFHVGLSLVLPSLLAVFQFT